MIINQLLKKEIIAYVTGLRTKGKITKETFYIIMDDLYSKNENEKIKE